MVKRVLMVAYHFPPMNVSSGMQRTLRFAQYLPDYGWEPVILTVHPRAYPSMSPAGLAEVPPHLHVKRAFALNTAKHLSLRGRYPSFLALPDRWWSWCLGGIPAGLAMIRELKPDVLWSTYPIATAHLIAYALHRITGIPWVADFRDPVSVADFFDPIAEPDDPRQAFEHRALKWITYQTLKHSGRAVFTTPGTLRLYAQRYPDLPQSRLTIIENGYDEAAFAGATQAVNQARSDNGPLVLVHSGTVYPSARDPRLFFGALAQLLRNGDIKPDGLRVVLRATGFDDHLRGLIEHYQIESIVTLAPALPYQAALAEMLAADALLVIQAANCNFQVPAKLYEYLRARRPIIALTDPAGDTAAVLRNAGIDTIARLDSQEEISRLLVRFIDLLRQQRAPVATDATIAAASRRGRTIELASVLNEVSGR